MNQSTKSNVSSSSFWLRLAFMVLFAVFVQLAAAVMWAVVVVQFLFNLFSGVSNEKLGQFGESLATFIYQCWQFLNYNSEEKPYPFQDWPTGSDR